MLLRDKRSILGRLSVDCWSTSKEVEEMAAEALQRPSLIKGIAELLFHELPAVQGKAARILAAIAEKQPQHVQPYKDLLIQEVAHNQHWVARYSFCYVITRLELTPQDVEQVRQILMAYLDNDSIGVKAAAMDALVGLIRIEPDLKEEIIPVIELLTQTGTRAMRARGRNLLKKLYKTEKMRGERRPQSDRQ